MQEYILQACLALLFSTLLPLRDAFVRCPK